MAKQDPPPERSGQTLAGTYWEPFRYSPEVDDAVCFSCSRWLKPEAFRLDPRGIPTWQCRECESKNSGD